MKELFGIAGAGWAILAGCVTPAAVAVVLFAFGALGYVDALDGYWSLTVGEQTLLLTLCAAVVGFGLYALQTMLYRVLEGYTWPAAVAAWGCRRQRDKRAAFLRRRAGMDASLREEEAALRWPRVDELIVPTKLGNRLRAFELYGVTRFELDSQTLWYELEAVAPANIRAEMERARMPVDFAVAALYLSGLYAAIAVGIAAGQSQGRLTLLAQAALAVTLIPLWYSMAVASADEWGAAVKALVNSGRCGLAEVLGLRMPTTLSEERTMWETLVRFVRGNYDESDLRTLDRYRDVGSVSSPSDAARSAAFVIIGDDEVFWFELLLGDGELIAHGQRRSSRADALADIAQLREATPVALVSERRHVPRQA